MSSGVTFLWVLCAVGVIALLTSKRRRIRRRKSRLWIGGVLLAVITIGGGGGTAAVIASSSGPANERLANHMAAQAGFDETQQACLDALWTHESAGTWSPTVTDPIYVPGLGYAYGIPQALPGDKMAAAGPDWQTDPVTQIRWGLGYIKSTYGTPCNAWSFDQAHSGY